MKHYKLALKHNCENHEAFERLVSNYLLTHEEKSTFITEIKFGEENLWLKEYYMSRLDETNDFTAPSKITSLKLTSPPTA